MFVSHISQVLKRQKRNKFICYKISKIISYIKKIKKLLKEQGLIQDEIMRDIYRALQINNNNQNYSHFQRVNRHIWEQHISEKLQVDGNKFAVSTLQSLYEIYKSLDQRLNQKKNQIQSQNKIMTKFSNIKMQEGFPSSKQQKKILNQIIKIQQQTLQEKQMDEEVNNKGIQKKGAHKNKMQRLQRKKKDLQKYLKMKIEMGNKKGNENSQKRDDEQCTRKYGPKVQMERYNSQQFDQVGKLRERLLGEQKKSFKKRDHRLQRCKNAKPSLERQIHEQFLKRQIS